VTRWVGTGAELAVSVPTLATAAQPKDQFSQGVFVASISRSDLVAALAQKADVSKSTADAVLSAFGEFLTDAVHKGDKVSIPGIVSVDAVTLTENTGRNPATGETINIPAGFGVKVSAGSRLKAAAK